MRVGFGERLKGYAATESPRNAGDLIHVVTASRQMASSTAGGVMSEKIGYAQLRVFPGQLVLSNR